jgi:hypothetical protein
MENQKKWYDYKLLVVFLIFIFFPVGLYALWKNKQISNGWKYGVTALIAGLFMISILSDDKPTETTEIQTVAATTETPEVKEEVVDPNTTLHNELQLVYDDISSKDFDFSVYLSDLSTLKSGVNFFNDIAALTNRSESSTVDSIKQLSKKLETELIKLQKKQFPVMRKKYWESIEHEMWKNDIDVTIQGKGNKILNFTGGTFASNQNKEDFQTLQNDALQMLRFNRVNYRFTKYDDEYTYYDVKSLSDDNIGK